MESKANGAKSQQLAAALNQSMLNSHTSYLKQKSVQYKSIYSAMTEQKRASDKAIKNIDLEAQEIMEKMEEFYEDADKKGVLLAFLDDAPSIASKMLQLDPDVSLELVARMEKQLDPLRPALKEMQAEPNNNQAAVALHAFRTMGLSLRRLYVVPSSMGKSRITITLTAFATARKKDLANVIVYFPSQLLLESDRKKYSKLQEIVPNVKIELVFTYQQLLAVIKPTSLAILDEADHFYLDLILQSPRCKYVVGLSATSFNDREGIEY
jgi:hypothetical protein